MLFADVNLVWCPSLTLLLDVDLNVLWIQTVLEIMFVNVKNVLRDLILVTPVLVVLELFVLWDPVATPFVDVSLDSFPSLTPLLDVVLNVLWILIAKEETISAKIKSVY